MKNITLSASERLIEQARLLAKPGTSPSEVGSMGSLSNAMIRRRFAGVRDHQKHLSALGSHLQGFAA